MLADDHTALLRRARKYALFELDAAFVKVDYGPAMIENLLPHRPPMLLIDHIEALDIAGGRIQGKRFLHQDDPGFDGHFPDYPVYPGVLQIEMTGQLSLCLAHFAGDPAAAGWLPDQARPPRVRLLKVLHATFMHELHPGEDVTIRARMVEHTGLTVVSLGQLSYGDRIASASLVEAVLIDDD